MKSLTLVSALCGLTSAHFVAKFPKGLDFNEDTEDKGPCGGHLPEYSHAVDFHVVNEAIAVKSTHPQTDWLFRVRTVDNVDTDWEEIFPIVQQSGIGDFCEPNVTVPYKYKDKKGILSIVAQASDGLLYQCIAVNFVDGAGETRKECTNSTGVKASFVDNTKLAALVGKGSGAHSGAGSSTSTSTSTSTSSGSPTTDHPNTQPNATVPGNKSSTSTPSKGAAASLQSWTASGYGLATMVVLSCMTVLGGALMF